MKILITITAILLIGFIISCSKESGPVPGSPSGSPSQNACEGISAKFSVDILPLVQNKCANSASCHATGSFNGPGALTSFTQVKNAASDIKSAVNSGFMPLGGSLSPTQLNQINCWIDSGSPNN